MRKANNLLASHPENSQILSSLKEGTGGIHAINQAIASNSPSPPFAGISGLPVGAPVVVTRNIPDLNLDNGTLGTVLNKDTLLFPNGPIQASQQLLEAIMPAYALTIHKAQGSQWDNVCIVVGQSRLLDRSLLYTAATRAVKTLTLIGQQADIIQAIQTSPRVFGIRTTLFDRIGEHP